MRTLIQLSFLFILAVTPVSEGDVSGNKPVQAGAETKLVKNLNDEEICAYKILKKIIQTESENKEKIVFFSKIQIIKKGGMLQISTNAKTTLKAFKSPSGSTTVNFGLILKNRIIHETSLPNDSVVIKSFVSYKPEFNTGRKAFCSKYEWEIYNTGSEYLTGVIANTDFILENEKQYQHVSYVNSDYAIVRKNDRFGVIGRNGRQLLPIIYNLIVNNDFGILVDNNGVYYYLDPLTNTKLSSNYTNVNVAAMYHLKQKLFPVTRNGKMTLLNSRFEEITPLIYDNFTTRGFGENKMILGHRDNQWFIFDSITGKELGTYIIK